MIWRRAARRAVCGPGAHLALAALLALTVPGCWGGEPESVEDPGKLTITLRSPAFTDGGMIPAEYTCDGAGGSPPLEWAGIPAEAKTLVLIVDDPDAPMGTFTHWVVADLPSGLQGLTAGVPAGEAVPGDSTVPPDRAGKSAGRQGKNDFGKLGYGGPCPPSGTHRYVFRLYAMAGFIELPVRPPTRAEVLAAIKGHIVAEGRLIGRYTRAK